MHAYLYVTLSVHARVVSLCVCLFVTLGIHAWDDYGSVCVCLSPSVCLHDDYGKPLNEDLLEVAIAESRK